MTAILNIACALQIRYYMFDIVSVRGDEFKRVFFQWLRNKKSCVLLFFL